MFREAFGAADVGANEDVLVLASHNETHMDALCHVHHSNTLYNGFPSDSVQTRTGATHCGIDKTPWIVARAVMLDLCRARGVDTIPAGQVITADELRACAEAQDTVPRPADVVLFRTGWLEAFMADPTGLEMASQPGIGMDAARLMSEWDVAAVGADNSAIEAIPFDGNEFLCVHVELLVHRGIPLLEYLVLADMARDGVHEALLVVAPLPTTGGTGSPINPIAIA